MKTTTKRHDDEENDTDDNKESNMSIANERVDGRHGALVRPMRFCCVEYPGHAGAKTRGGGRRKALQPVVRCFLPGR